MYVVVTTKDVNMEKIFNIVKNNDLFEGVIFKDFEKLYPCLSPIRKKFKKSEIILNAGDKANYVYIILSGSVKIVKSDIDGKDNVLTELSVSDIFGEVFACANILHSHVTVVSLQESEVLFLNYKKIITSCQSACSYHSKLISNMLKLVAKKNIMLHQKIELISKRTTRERLLLYFDIHRRNQKKFTIPHSRENLAAYLCVDRSAMSNEFSKMQKEGIIKYDKNQFEIL